MLRCNYHKSQHPLHCHHLSVYTPHHPWPHLPLQKILASLLLNNFIQIVQLCPALLEQGGLHLNRFDEAECEWALVHLCTCWALWAACVSVHPAEARARRGWRYGQVPLSQILPGRDLRWFSTFVPPHSPQSLSLIIFFSLIPWSVGRCSCTRGCAGKEQDNRKQSEHVGGSIKVLTWGRKKTPLRSNL